MNVHLAPTLKPAYLLPLILLIGATSCEKRTPTPARDTPSYHWEVNEVEYKPCEPYYEYFAPYNVHSSYYSQYNVWQISMSFKFPENENCWSDVSLYIERDKIGKIFFNEITTSASLGFFKDSLEFHLDYQSDPNDSSNYLNLSRNLGSKWPDNEWITGEFQFTGINKNDSTDTIQITNGYINHNITYR
jgi:hypothetical protein